MNKTKIEWTDVTWNPLRGTKGIWHCTKVSDGCKNCYAERLNIRFSGLKFQAQADTLRLDEKILNKPLSWKKPRMVFVCSMTDLFHEDASYDWVDKVFRVMLDSPQHTFQILTKRPERMHEYLHNFTMTLSNVWVGVSVENQEAANERIPYLLNAPAAIRWLSMEPLLGPVKLNDRIPGKYTRDCLSGEYWKPGEFLGNYAKIDWVVVGGESGSGARPMKVEWVESLRDQCKEAGTPFFFKQGSQKDWDNFRDFDSFREDLRIREYPETA